MLMPQIFLWSLVAFILLEKFLETQLSRRNRIKAMAEGAKEYGARHYPAIIFLNMLWYVCWILESFSRGPTLSSFWYIWFTLFVLAEMLRYWAIAHLGRFWCTRIIIIPNTKLVLSGPFRFIPHPVYVALVVEIVCVPLIFGAWISATLSAVGALIFLLAIRIPAENRALNELR